MPSNIFLFCVCFYLDELHLLIHRPVHIYPTGCVMSWISSWISISGVYKALPLQTFVPSGTHTPVLRARTKAPSPASSGADTQCPPLQAPCGLWAGAAAHSVCSELTLAQELPPQMQNLRGWTAPAPGEGVTGPGLSLHLLRTVPERRTRPRQVWEPRALPRDAAGPAPPREAAALRAPPPAGCAPTAPARLWGGDDPAPCTPHAPQPRRSRTGGPWRGQTGGAQRPRARAGARRSDRGPARSPRGEAALLAPGVRRDGHGRYACTSIHAHLGAQTRGSALGRARAQAITPERAHRRAGSGSRAQPRVPGYGHTRAPDTFAPGPAPSGPRPSGPAPSGHRRSGPARERQRQRGERRARDGAAGQGGAALRAAQPQVRHQGSAPRRDGQRGRGRALPEPSGLGRRPPRRLGKSARGFAGSSTGRRGAGRGGAGGGGRSRPGWARGDPGALQRWKRGWFALFPASQHGVARLEFFDCKEPAGPPGRLGTRRLDKTVVRLADCTSVAPAPAESGPRAGTVAFRLETSGRSYLLAADKQQSEEWVAKLCEIAFPVSGAGLAPLGPGVAAGGGRRAPLPRGFPPAPPCCCRVEPCSSPPGVWQGWLGSGSSWPSCRCLSRCGSGAPSTSGCLTPGAAPCPAQGSLPGVGDMLPVLGPRHSPWAPLAFPSTGGQSVCRLLVKAVCRTAVARRCCHPHCSTRAVPACLAPWVLHAPSQDGWAVQPWVVLASCRLCVWGSAALQDGCCIAGSPRVLPRGPRCYSV